MKNKYYKSEIANSDATRKQFYDNIEFDLYWAEEDFPVMKGEKEAVK